MPIETNFQYALEVSRLDDDTFVIVCRDRVNGSKAGKTALVDHCLPCALATCSRLISSGAWESLAFEPEG